MAEKKSDQSFWTTLPGILTGLAALFTATAGLVAALTAAGVLGSHPATPTAVAANPTGQPVNFAPASATAPSTVGPLPGNTPSPAVSLSPAVPSTATAAPTGAMASCSIQIGAVFANLWTNAEVRTRVKCPTQPSVSIDTAVEAFQRGFMVWRKDNGAIYVFADDKTWYAFQDAFRSGVDPEFSCGIQASPPSPRRGFSQVWCGNPRIHASLGDALEAEQGFCMAGTGPCEVFQDFENGLMYKSTRFSRSYVVFADSGTWQ